MTQNSVISQDTPDEVLELQEDLNLLVDWANKWQMNFNVDKCAVMNTGHNNIQQQHNNIRVRTASIGGASSRWMYPDSEASRRRSWAKSPPSLLLLRALRPGAARPGDGFGAPGNVRLVPYSTHFFTRGVWRAGSHTLPHYTRRRRWEQPWTIKSLHVSHLLPTHYQQQKIQGLCPMHLLQRLGPHHLYNTY